MIFVLLLGVAFTGAVLLQEPSSSEDSCGYESCTQAEAGLLNVHIVPHTHDDVGWLKTVDQYYYGSRNNIQKAGVQYIIDSVVKELWEDPKRRFMYVETAFFWKWWNRQSDDVRNKVHTLVRQGRLQFVGGAWSMNDEAASHYQSTIDQFTWGLRKLNETFGKCGMPRVGWQIDPFGHSREFASLLAGMGYDGLFLGRIDYQDKRSRLNMKNMEMLWRGDDDLGKPSDIFTGVLYNTYSPPPGFCFDVLCDDEPIVDDPASPMFNVDSKVENFIKICRNMSKGYATNNILVTMGEDFHYQDAAMWYKNLDKLIQRRHVVPKLGQVDLINEFINYVKKQSEYYRTSNVVVTMGGDFTYQDAAMWYQNLDKLIKYTNLKAAKDGLDMKLFYSTPDCYLKAVKDSNPTLPTKQDDFFPYASDPTAYWTGYFTSRPTTKLFEREGNGYLQMVKNLQVLSDLEKHNMFVINELQSAVGVMQHHDAITGTEKEHVTHDYERLLDAAVEDASIVAKQAFNKITGGNAAEPPTFEYVRCRLNESSCHVTETSDKFVITVYNPVGWQTVEPIRLPVGSGAYRVITPGGLEIDSQIIEISDAVKNIPSRKSSASRELVFIAHLHPLGVKSFYVEKVGKSKRHAQNNRDYYHINSYWKDIKIQPKIDDTKNVEHNYKVPLPVEKVKYAERVDMDLDDLAMLKGDGFKEVDLESIFGDRSQVRSGGRNLDKQKYSNLNEEEMRMLSDEPLIVDRYKEFYVENQNLKLRIDNATSQITHAFTDDITTNMQIAFFYWTGCVGNNSIYSERSSGAYIFRPKTTTPIPITSKITKVFKGPVVQELRVESTENVGSTIRMYTGVPYIEHEFVVGPIDITDNVGKEYIVRYNTNIFNNGIFYTDSNGRQMLKRKLNERPQWNLTLEEPIAGNYYPVTTNMFIEDENIRASVLTDRSEGGTSLEEGSLEIMLHRRLLHDDAFGVGEALNETANGKGLVMRGKHRVMLYKPTEDSILMERKQILQMHLTPIVFVADAKNVDLAQWLTLNNCFKPLQQELPNGVHLLTLEPWDDKHILIRFENYKDKSPNSTIEIDLASIFDVIKIISIRETTLAANQWLDEYNKWDWMKEGKFSKRFNDDYNNYGPKVTAADEDEVVSDYGFKIKLKAKQIRTFIAEYEILKF